jgi:hypothetical protein
LHLAAFHGNIKVGIQVTGIYPFNRDTLHDEEIMGVTLQIDLALLWLQQVPAVTLNPQRRRLILQHHKNLLQRMKLILLTQRTFDLFLKPGPERVRMQTSRRENCHFDWYIVKYALKETTTQVFEQMKKTAPKTRGKSSVCKISSEIFTKETPKNIKKSKNASDTKEGSKDILCPYCLDACSRSASREMWIQCIVCKFRVHEKCTDGSPNFIRSNYSPIDRNTLFKNECWLLYAAAALCYLCS